MEKPALFNIKPDKEKPKKKRKKNPDKAPSLVDYFYSLTKTKCPSYPRECHNVNALLKKGYTPDQIRLTMMYLHKHKNIDLKWINRTIEEAILDDKYWNERNIENTPAYFVKMFYNKTQVKFNRIYFLSNVRRIQMLLDEGYTYKDIIRAIDYMKINKINVFNYIDTIIIHTEKSVGNNELKYATSKVTFDTYNIAVDMYTNKTYFDKLLTKFEYAYLIHLPLNKELIKIGLQDKKENNYKCNIQNVTYDKNDFLEWLQTQFSVNQIPYEI